MQTVFFIEILSFSKVTVTNPYTSNVTEQCRYSPMLIFRAWATCDIIYIMRGRLIRFSIYYYLDPIVAFVASGIRYIGAVTWKASGEVARNFSVKLTRQQFSRNSTCEKEKTDLKSKRRGD